MDIEKLTRLLHFNALVWRADSADLCYGSTIQKSRFTHLPVVALCVAKWLAISCEIVIHWYDPVLCMHWNCLKEWHKYYNQIALSFFQYQFGFELHCHKSMASKCSSQLIGVDDVSHEACGGEANDIDKILQKWNQISRKKKVKW